MARKKKAPASPGQLEQSPAGLTRAESAAPEVVAWVARHIDVADVRPEDCPDPFAWTLLRLCRHSPEFTTWFIDKLWSKLIPSRSQLDTGRGDGFDGQVTIDLIDRIRAMRDKAQGPKRSQITGDMIPEPEIPDAFAAFDPRKDPL